MAFQFSDPRIGAQAISETSTTQQHPIGTVLRAWDPTYGEGEFVYLKGLALTAVGEVVIYDQYANTTKRAVAGDRGPCAVAMSANVASQYGWYQIDGAAIVKSATVLAGGNVFLTATAGQVDDAVVAGDKIEGMRFKTADGTPAAGQAVCEVERPSANANG